MKKKQKVLNTVRGFLLFLAALICVIPLSTVRASEMSGTWDIEPEDEAISESAEYGEEMIEKFSFEDIDRSLQDLFPDERVKFKETMMGILSGDLTFSMELVKSLAADQLGYAFGSSRDNLVHMLLIALIAAVFGNFSKTFKSRQIVDISFYVMYLLLIALTLSSFQTVTEWVSEGIESLTSFMSVFCPLYFLAVSIAKGSITSVAFYNLVLFLIFLTEFLILDFLLPLIHIYMIVKVLNYCGVKCDTGIDQSCDRYSEEKRCYEGRGGDPRGGRHNRRRGGGGAWNGRPGEERDRHGRGDDLYRALYGSAGSGSRYRIAVQACCRGDTAGVG